MYTTLIVFEFLHVNAESAFAGKVCIQIVSRRVCRNFFLVAWYPAYFFILNHEVSYSGTYVKILQFFGF